jgi:putative FmdB family regulatory protein
MPTYEYRCEACGHDFEQFQSITAAPIKKCPQCGKNKVKRLLGTGAGLIFKGSGFYITDYRPESYTKAARAEQGGADSASKDASGNGQGSTTDAAKAPKESKPAAKAETKATAKAGSGSKSKARSK